jgi:hypothetical protein
MSETLVNLYQATRCYSPEDSRFRTPCRENITFYLITSSLKTAVELSSETFYIPDIPQTVGISNKVSKSVAPESEGSSPHSREPATGPYPEPGEFIPHPWPSQSPQDPFWSHPTICSSVFRVASFLQAFPPKPCTLFSLLLCLPHAPATSFFFISSA